MALTERDGQSNPVIAKLAVDFVLRTDDVLLLLNPGQGRHTGVAQSVVAEREELTVYRLELVPGRVESVGSIVAAEAVILDAIKADCNYEEFKKSRLESKKMITAIAECAKASLK